MFNHQQTSSVYSNTSNETRTRANSEGRRWYRRFFWAVVLLGMTTLTWVWYQTPDLYQKVAVALHLKDETDALFDAAAKRKTPTPSRPLFPEKTSDEVADDLQNVSRTTADSSVANYEESPLENQFAEQYAEEYAGQYANEWAESSPYKIGVISRDDDMEIISHTGASGDYCMLDENGTLVCHNSDNTESNTAKQPLFTVSESVPSHESIPSGTLTSSPIPYSNKGETISPDWQNYLDQAGATHCRLERWGNQRQFWRFSCQIHQASGTCLYCDAVAEQPDAAIRQAISQ